MGRSRILLVAFFSWILFTSCTKEAENDTARYYLLEDSTVSLSAEQAWQAFKHDRFEIHSQSSFNPGFTTSCYWLVANPDSRTDQAMFLEIGSAQINEILFYEIVNDQPVLRHTTGDHFPFSSRPIRSLNFTFPLKTQSSHYLLRINKRNESLQLTFVTRPALKFFEESTELNLTVGVMTGAILLMLIFGVFLYAITRELVYLFYILYIAAGWLYVWANQGFVYKYLLPDFPWFAARTRPVAALLTISFSLHFIKYYVGEAPFRWLRKTLIVITYASYLLAILFLIPNVETKATTFGYYAQAVLPILASVYIVSMLITVGHQVLNKNRMAMFYLLSIMPIVIFSTLQIFYYSGGMNFSGFLQRYGQATGYVAEAIILTFGLAYRFNTYKEEKQQLLINLNRQQVRYAKAIITTQENERRQLADQLHDVAGSLLSAARLNLSAVREKNFIVNEDAKAKLASAENAISDISNILRNMSHAISPIMLDKVGFRQSIEKIVGIFNAAGKIRFETDILGFDIENSHMYEKYSVLYSILYELMNNIVKHANATHALIQVVEHDDSVILIVEDNGVGMAGKSVTETETHGLTAIHSKVHYLGGIVVMEEAQPHGLIVTIEIPKVNHDENNHS